MVAGRKEPKETRLLTVSLSGDWMTTANISHAEAPQFCCVLVTVCNIGQQNCSSLPEDADDLGQGSSTVLHLLQIVNGPVREDNVEGVVGEGEVAHISGDDADAFSYALNRSFSSGSALGV